MKDPGKADLVIRNARVFNSYLKKFTARDVYIRDGLFFYLDERKQNEIQAAESLGAVGRYLVPGLIDIHMHIESSLVTPRAFGEHTVSHGLTTIVSEPHEIANVCGMAGIKAMIADGRKAPYDIYYAIPSNVPVMGAEFETAGAKITCEDMLELKDTENVICLGEVMNYLEIIRENDSEVGKFIDIVNRTDPRYIKEGHCPQLKDADLARFLYLGIGSDHCTHDLEGLRQRFENGMFVQIQDVMMKQEVIDYIIDNELYECFSFVTDDTFPDFLVERGHLDNIVRKAIKMGMKPEMAIYCATHTPAVRMKLTDRGDIAPGKLADFLLLDDLEQFSICATYKNGKKVYDRRSYRPSEDTYTLGKQFEETVRISVPNIEDFEVRLPGKDRTVNVRVMEISRHNNVVGETWRRMAVVNNRLQWQDTDCRLVMVLERHGKNGHISYGFSSGDDLKEGAVASSLTHDSHNVIVMGTNAADMKQALEELVRLHGGFVVVNKGNITGELALPIAGLMSNHSVEQTARDFTGVRKAMEAQGYVHGNTVMNLCLLSLTCSPFLKLTDQGYMDTVNLKMVPLYEEL
ncbi:MAG: adenine deaminase [Erysipelotrichaceae bacterium]|nr:adenine deaminase [Erysipelotrichaceae bacterium]